MSGYFGELTKGYTAKTWYYVLRGVILIGLGIGVFIIPRSIFIVLLFTLVAMLAIQGGYDVYQLMTGKVVPHMRPQVKAMAIIQLVAAGVLLLFTAFAIDLVVIICGLLMIVRGALALITFLTSDDISVTQRWWLIISAVVSFVIGILVVLSPVRNLELFVFFVGVFAILEGISLIRQADELAHNITVLNEYNKTLLGNITEEVEMVWTENPNGIPTGTIKVDASDVARPELKKSPLGKRGWLTIDLEKYKRPVIVAPHPDDLEGFLGGLAFELPAPVTSIVLAGGNKGVWEERYIKMVEETPREYIKVRLDEAAIAGQLLGVNEIIYMGYLDRGVVCNEEAIQKMLHVFEDIQPDLVASFEWRKRITPYPHPDHINTANIARNAVARYAKNHQVDYILASTLAPNRFLDVSSARRVKLQALECHTTQSDLNAIIFPIFEKTITRLWGLFTNSRYAEGYRWVNLSEIDAGLAKDSGIIA
jgi:LmbE family N-acetylglucosaminyl deacetylase/uncharacterized membrane protein HdeD (DUF308 family)